MPRRKQVPTYRLHRASGQAVVTINGRDHYLGKHGSAESRETYGRLIAESSTGIQKPIASAAPDGAMTITELILQYWEFAQSYYVKRGRPTSEQDLIKHALRPLRKLYGQTRAQEFGPLALKVVRQAFIEAGLVRLSINRNVGRIGRMFKWAAENELVPGNVYQNLRAVSGLRRGRSEAVESDGVKPVPESVVQATFAHLSPTLAAMVRLQELTGMRSGELVAMRSADIDMSGKTWTYVPAEHKTEHHGYTQPVGEHLKYLVFAQDRPIACLAWSSAPRHLGCRDRFIGWSPLARRRNIRFIAYNLRFLILPWVEIRHLASHLLGCMARRLPRDWQQLYGHPVYFLETFVDPGRFRGTCYYAANWTRLGHTTGRGKDDQTMKPNRPIKDVLGYPLCRDFRERLQHIE